MKGSGKDSLGAGLYAIWEHKMVTSLMSETTNNSYYN